MPSKPNYNHQRAERNRAKQAKKEEKLAQKKEQSALRQAGHATQGQTDAGAGSSQPTDLPDEAGKGAGE